MDPMNIRREIDGRPPVDRDRPPARTKRQRSARQERTPAKPKRPPASERASILAQDWYDRGEARGLSFPYDVNFMALALAAKIEQDPAMAPYLAKGQHDRVQRWVAKMIERWWEEYVDGVIHAGNAKDYFLGTDWDDVRYYAKSCLQARYLKEHGRRVPAPMYPQQQEYQQRLKTLQDEAKVSRHIQALEEAPAEPPTLDEKGRSRLRSFVEKRRKK